MSWTCEVEMSQKSSSRAGARGSPVSLAVTFPLVPVASLLSQTLSRLPSPRTPHTLPVCLASPGVPLILPRLVELVTFPGQTPAFLQTPAHLEKLSLIHLVFQVKVLSRGYHSASLPSCPVPTCSAQCQVLLISTGPGDLWEVVRTP